MMFDNRYILFVYTYEAENLKGCDYFYVDSNLKTEEEILMEARNRVELLSMTRKINITDFRISDDENQIFLKLKDK